LIPGSAYEVNFFSPKIKKIKHYGERGKKERE